MSTATGTATETAPAVTLAKVGQPAPDFNMPSTRNIDTLAENVKLADYKGKWLILLFYPLDFTFVCPTELISFSDRLEEFEGVGAEVLAVSTDSVHSHRAWLKTPQDQNGIEGVKYPIASDVGKARPCVQHPGRGREHRSAWIVHYQSRGRASILGR